MARRSGWSSAVIEIANSSCWIGRITSRTPARVALDEGDDLDVLLDLPDAHRRALVPLGARKAGIQPGVCRKSINAIQTEMRQSNRVKADLSVIASSTPAFGRPARPGRTQSRIAAQYRVLSSLPRHREPWRCPLSRGVTLAMTGKSDGRNMPGRCAAWVDPRHLIAMVAT